MRTIGLVRHFKVIQPKPKKKWMTSTEFETWVDEYDYCDVIVEPTTLDSSDWDICFSSDLSRAVTTSNQLYKNDIIVSEQLREIKIKSLPSNNIILHYRLWLIIGRLTWLLIDKSNPNSQHEIVERVRAFVDRIEQLSASRILVVSHGALMWYIRKELIKRRYKGPMYIKPQNGKLYIFHRTE